MAIQSAKAKKNSIWPYIKLQLKLSFFPTTITKKSTKILSWIAKAFILALVFLFAYAFVKSLTNQTKLVNGNNLAIVIVTLVQLFLLIYSISIQTKRLYKPGDLRIISTLPYTTFQRYLGEIIAIYLRLAIYSLVLIWPILMIYCGAARIEISPNEFATLLAINPAKYVFSSLFAAILIPLFPFALSLVISVPFMHLGSFLKDKHITKLIIFIVIFSGLLILYGFLLKFMADWYIHAKNNVEVMKGIAAFLNGLNKPYNFCFFMSETFLVNKLYFNLPIYLLIVVGFAAIGIAITKPLYKKFSELGLSESASTIKHSKINEANSYKAIFNKEFKQILRTPSYAYFYLCVALSTPILTFLEADIIKKIGAAQVGTRAFFGFGLLIICIIISLIGSYTANIVSREGRQFYITKISPISYRKQLLAKAIVNFMVSFVAWLLCILVLAATCMTSSAIMAGLDIKGLWYLIGISLLYLIGITFNGINIDVAFPKIDMLSTKINDRNIVVQLIIGFIITALMSVLAITVGAINEQSIFYVQLFLILIMFVYALINFLVWFFTCEKKYAKIEIK